MCEFDARPVCDLSAPAVRIAVASRYRQDTFAANGAVVHVFRDFGKVQKVEVRATAEGVVEVLGDAELWRRVHQIVCEVVELLRSAVPAAEETTELVAA